MQQAVVLILRRTCMLALQGCIMCLTQAFLGGNVLRLHASFSRTSSIVCESQAHSVLALNEESQFEFGQLCSL